MCRYASTVGFRFVCEVLQQTNGIGNATKTPAIGYPPASQVYHHTVGCERRVRHRTVIAVPALLVVADAQPV